MSNDTNMNNDKKSISYGAKLKAAREAIGLEQKDIAAQLRLGERIIEMLESGHYAADVPTTFIRGYIRSYSKLLQIPESEVAAALEPIQHAPTQIEAPQPTNKTFFDLKNSKYYMQLSTYAIVATLAGMLGLWWYNHTPARSMVAQNQTITVSDAPNVQANKQVTEIAPSVPLAPVTNNPNTTAPAANPTGPAIAAANPVASSKPAIAPKRVIKPDDEDDEDDDHYTD